MLARSPELFQYAGTVLLHDLVAVSAAVRATRSRNEKISLLAATLRRLDPEEAAIGIAYLSGHPPQERLGVGFATLNTVRVAPAADPSLQILEVDDLFQTLATTSGAGAQAQRTAILAELYAEATAVEQEYLTGLILRNLRQGALDGIMADAVAVALDVEPHRVRRAAMLSGDLAGMAAQVLAQGPAALTAYGLTVLTPVQAMLAGTAGSPAEAIERSGTAVVDVKVDGARIQVHRRGDDVAVFSRNLRDITARVPEIVAVARRVPADPFILDGEAVLLDAAGRPEPFQDSMSRFGRAAVEPTRDLTPLFFDLLHIEGADLIDVALTERREHLLRALPRDMLVASLVTSSPDEAESFFADAIDAGFEGVVVKAADGRYEAGRRGSSWLKVKPEHTLDLVVLAAEWGSGRRRGLLSNLHLGARDPASGDFIMLGKTFKGLTDEMLAWQTGHFLGLEVGRTGRIVHVRPDTVYEIAFDGVQRSRRYAGGVALRFARVKRHRSDKTAADADTIETVRGFLRG